MDVIIRCGALPGKSADSIFPENKLKLLGEIFSEYISTEHLLPEAVLHCEVSLVLAERDEMAGLNLEYRETEGPTDVLSFPMWEDEEGRFSPPDDWESLMLGDIVVCPEIAEANAKENGESADRELALIVCHGFLHLLGFDHAEDGDRESMWKAQGQLLDRFIDGGGASDD